MEPDHLVASDSALRPVQDVGDELAGRLQAHAEAAHGAYAHNTERALRADSAIFTGWCIARGRPALPAAPATIAAFVDALADAKAPATIRRYVASIAALHRAARVDDPCRAAEVRLALRRLHRAKRRAQVQAGPLNRQLVERMLEAADVSTRDLRDKALLATGYDSLARRSELVALTLADLARASDGSGTIRIRRGKTDQEGEGMLRYLAPDTMRHVEAWIAAAGLTDGALFRAVGRSGRAGGKLDPGDVGRLYRSMASRAGLPEATVARLSGHSTRVGAAQDMVAANIELTAVMQAGGWQSPVMVARYTAQLQARRGAAAKLAVAQNRE